MVWRASVWLGKFWLGKTVGSEPGIDGTWNSVLTTFSLLGGWKSVRFHWLLWAARCVPESASTGSRGWRDGRTKGLVWPLFHARLPSSGVCTKTHAGCGWMAR